MEKVSSHLSQLHQKTQTRDVKRVSETLRGSTLWEQSPESSVQSQSKDFTTSWFTGVLSINFMLVVRMIKIAHMCQNVFIGLQV